MNFPSVSRQALERDVEAFNVNVIAAEELEAQTNQYMDFVQEAVASQRLPPEQLHVACGLDAQTQRLMMRAYQRVVALKKVLVSPDLTPGQITSISMFIGVESRYLTADIAGHAALIEETKQLLTTTFQL